MDLLHKKISLFFIFLAISFLIFLWGNKKHYCRVNVFFSPNNIPYIEMNIQGNPYLIGMDLGSSFDLSLRKAVLDALYKTPYEFSKNQDLGGNTWYAISYRISDVKVGDQKFKDIVVAELDESEAKKVIIFPEGEMGEESDTRQERAGFIGMPLFEKTNLLLDFSQAAAIFIEDKKGLKEAGYHLDTFTKVPFQRKSSGIILKAKTDFGDIRLLLDTGCTVSFIRASLGAHRFNNMVFILGDRDFGAMYLYPFGISPNINDFDGILGMDFLCKHIIYIDQEEQAIYIGDHPKSDERS